MVINSYTRSINRKSQQITYNHFIKSLKQSFLRIFKNLQTFAISVIFDIHKGRENFLLIKVISPRNGVLHIEFTIAAIDWPAHGLIALFYIAQRIAK